MCLFLFSGWSSLHQYPDSGRYPGGGRNEREAGYREAEKASHTAQSDYPAHQVRKGGPCVCAEDEVQRYNQRR